MNNLHSVKTPALLMLCFLYLASCKSDVLKFEELIDEQCRCKDYDFYVAVQKEMDQKFSRED
ncbi:MAG: hypothetical protein GY811_23315 [Myxococcales bacterium]|nr:hypothetical protein [Myxococcales bacterium]